MPDLKAALRREARARRAAAHAADPDAGVRLVAAFAATGVQTAGAVVAGYVAFGTEIDPGPLLDDCACKGARLALPRTPPRDVDGPVTFHAWARGEPVEAGPFTVPEPSKTAPEVVPAVVFAPLLGFDLRGGRLGYGKGHYDRALGALPVRPLLIGLAHGGQRFDRIPLEAHDIRLDWIVTPDGAYPCQES